LLAEATQTDKDADIGFLRELDETVTDENGKQITLKNAEDIPEDGQPGEDQAAKQQEEDDNAA
jgi:hypothetical protein